MKLLKVLGRIFKGLYDIFATYLLAWVLFFALVASGFHFGLEALAHARHFDSIAAWWQSLSARHGQAGILWLRLLVFGGLHAGIIYLLRRPLGRVQAGVEKVFDRTADVFRYLTRDRSKLRLAGNLLFTLVVTLLLVPFVLQPTLVPDYTSARAWLERGANLADGTASRFVADSVVGLYRKIYAEPVRATGGVSADDVDAAEAQVGEGQIGDRPGLPDVEGPTAPPAPVGKQPLMDRWDPQIRRAAGGDPQKFAYIKAFMWVESAGRQFAVSHTGCSGLMQFCAGTARSRPYRKVFGTGRVYACQCDGQCRIDARTRRGLETGEVAPTEVAERFPCELTDARFDPDRSIRAGALYVERLAKRFDGNIYLMYIGYNSGPAVADAVFDRVGRNGDATLADIQLHLADAMRPHYGAGSERRARSLVRTHLPKIKRAFERYYETGEIAMRRPPTASH